MLLSIKLTFLFIRYLQCRYVLKGHSGRVAAIVCPSLYLSATDLLTKVTDTDIDREGTIIASCGLDRRVLLWDTSSASSLAPSADSAVEMAMSDAMAKKIKSSPSDSRRDSKEDPGEDSAGNDPQLPLVVVPCMLYASGVYRGAEDAVRSAAGPLVGLCVSPSPSSSSQSKPKHLPGSEQRAGSFVLAAASAGQYITYHVMMLILLYFLLVVFYE